jgi:tRNA modification GTPase
MFTDTIAAISTPLGPGGIGIIRVSGPDARLIFSRLFRRPGPSAVPFGDGHASLPIQSHRVYYGFVADPLDGNVIDEVLALYMQGPKSFTREDVVEFHSHSGIVVLDRLLSAVVEAGASLAEPGAFTKRAFLNGRIDLTQAEAVIDLINAPCEAALRIAGRHIAGGLRAVVDGMVNTIVGLQAKCEAIIEFGESDAAACQEEFEDAARILGQFLLPEITALIRRHKEAAVYRDGLSLTIAGMPNVGKSSLLNKLVQKETAIVTEIPGTTRDVVREYSSINGVPVIICDTAGIHDTTDPVECIGIARARGQIESADVVLLVVEANRPLMDFEQRLFEESRAHQTIVVINKDDIANERAVAAIEMQLGAERCVRVSALTGTGLDALRRRIFNGIVAESGMVAGERVSPNLRQRNILERAARESQALAAAMETQPAIELISEKMNLIRRVLEEISGSRGQEDLYEHIFSQFCVGK